jgi:hypothetical protein
VEVSRDGGLDEAIRTTRELVADPKIPAIFEGTFEHGGVLVRVDILHRRTDGRRRLIEVKSSTDPRGRCAVAGQRAEISEDLEWRGQVHDLIAKMNI